MTIRDWIPVRSIDPIGCQTLLLVTHGFRPLDPVLAGDHEVAEIGPRLQRTFENSTPGSLAGAGRLARFQGKI
jgi:hypothetical protein